MKPVSEDIDNNRGEVCLSWEFERVSERAVELRDLERRQVRDKVSQFTFEHQGKEIAADRAGARQAVFRAQHDLRCEPENVPVDGRANYSRDILMFGNKGSGDYDVKTRLVSALRNPLSRSINLASPHERACSEMSARAWRASRLRCFRKIAPSLTSVARLRSFSAYRRGAARTSAVRLRRRRDERSASLFKSFEVFSSMTIFFMRRIIPAILTLPRVSGCDSGAKPADLPVQPATKFEFIVNLKAAKQIGLTIPVRVLERANQVIK
jgi:hypothetical protein